MKVQNLQESINKMTEKYIKIINKIRNTWYVAK